MTSRRASHEPNATLLSPEGEGEGLDESMSVRYGRGGFGARESWCEAREEVAVGERERDPELPERAVANSTSSHHFL